MSLHRLLAFAVTALLGALPSAGQFNSSIQGEVTDPSSALVPGVTVRITNLQTGVSREAAVRMAVESADNVLAALAGRLDPAVVVNPEVLG